MKSRKSKLTMSEAWSQAFGRLARNSRRLARELEGAREQFPVLVRAANLLLGYYGFLSRQARWAAANSRLLGMPTRGGLVGFTPWPPDPGSERPPLPEEICRFIPTHCRCFNDGDRQACMDLVDDEDDGSPGLGLGDSFRQVRTCQDVCRDYRAALQCAMQYCGSNTLSRVELRQWVQCQQRINELWNELHERGCINTRSFTIVAGLVATRSARQVRSR